MLDDSAEALELAKQNMRKRKFNAAIEILTPAIKEDARNADLFNCLATANYLAGDLDEALKAFQQVTKIKPTLAAAWVNIGAVYNRLGKYHEAVRALRKGIQRDKRAAQGYYNLGIAQKGLNRLAMAATAYKDAIKIDPKMAEAHQNLGNVYLDMGNSRQAITSFKKALELRPDFPRAKKGLAIAENAAGEQIQKDNPFGRLVSKEDLAGQKTDEAFRELSDEERYEDRQYIRGQTGTVRENTRKLITFLREKLEPSILQLGRVVCSSDTGKDLAGLFDEFQQNYTTAKALQAEIHREMAELKKHDTEIRT